MEIGYGFCKCGCGGKTKIMDRTHRRYGWIKGEPLSFINGHQQRGKYSSNWNGGVRRYVDGYIGISIPNHKRANSQGYVGEHILVMEKFIGRSLKDEEVVHHINEDKSNNSIDNLLLCDNHKYHMYIHQQIRANKECGHADWRKCWICKKYDEPKNLCIYPSQTGAFHRGCFINRKKQREEQNHVAA